jgi:geranylgeranyl reductase family protein
MKENSSYDVIVVGGGPGGSSCSTFLSSKGKKVLLLDKATFPRDKTCGDGISGKSMRVLKELGLLGQIEAEPHAIITGVIFSGPDGTEFQIPIPKQPDGKQEYGYCSRREVFDNVLFQNAKKKGVHVIENFTVTDLVMDGSKVTGVKGKGADGAEKEFSAKIVVGADGANSVVATKLGVREVDPAHWCAALRTYYKGVKGLTPNIELHFVDGLMPGYFWIFPLENGTANVGAGMVLKDMNDQKINLKEATLKVIAENPKFKARFEGATMVDPAKGWRGWNLPFGSKKWPVAGDGWVLIGDAATLVDPFTGEGIGNALLSGKLASQTIVKALDAGDYSKDFLFAYEKELRETVDVELNNSYRMQRLGNHKWLLNFFMHKAAKNPEVREAIADTLLDSKNRQKFLNPLFYVRMVLS